MQNELEVTVQLLFTAIDNKNEAQIHQTINRILEKGPNYLSFKNDDGETFLFYALKQISLQTPISEAGKRIVFYLLEVFKNHAPDSIFLADLSGFTILHLVSVCHIKFAIEFLEKIKESFTNESLVQYINQPTRIDGFTPLMLACGFWKNKSCDLQLIEWLYKNGASLDSRCKIGRTPFLYACQSREKSLIELLYRLGAATQDRDKDGISCWHILVDRCDYDSFQWLLKAELEQNNPAIALLNVKEARYEHMTPVELALHRYCLTMKPIKKLALQNILQCLNQFYYLIGQLLPAACFREHNGQVLFCDLPLQQWQLFAANTDKLDELTYCLPYYDYDDQLSNVIQHIGQNKLTKEQLSHLLKQLQRLRDNPIIPSTHRIQQDITALQKYVSSQHSLKEFLFYTLAQSDNQQKNYDLIKKEAQKYHSTNLFTLFRDGITKYESNCHYKLVRRKIVELEQSFKDLNSFMVTQINSERGWLSLVDSITKALEKNHFLKIKQFTFAALLTGVTLWTCYYLCSVPRHERCKHEAASDTLLLSKLFFTIASLPSVSYGLALLLSNYMHRALFRNLHASQNSVVQDINVILDLLPSGSAHIKSFGKLRDQLATCNNWYGFQFWVQNAIKEGGVIFNALNLIGDDLNENQLAMSIL
ncbi:Ankyrin repeat [Legionella beliardensis]|uniref:Ankyrin repeat n=1 Tax=Legionella beliardensis TaxID=91822 RepID=A0A378I0Q2_9GAMM|nr:ankyrin repeat domain-containing protein [Legionella beliardensis]STX28777.1 Ankyrin repeat [Legionella beliardensis]